MISSPSPDDVPTASPGDHLGSEGDGRTATPEPATRPTRSPRWRRILRWTLILSIPLGITFALGRPRLLEDQELKAEVLSRFQPKKVASLEQTGISKIGNVSVRDYATARTFPLVNGGESALRVTRGEGNGFTIESVDQVSGVGRGSATVLTKDGYLLTADHCLGKERPYVFCPTPDGKVEAVEARVVWRRVDKDKEPDFAIIHVPRTLPFAFPMRQRDPVSREKTISAGFGGFTDSA